MKKGSQEVRAALKGLAGATGPHHQLLEIQRCPVGAWIPFEIAPGIFDGIQLGGVGREEDRVDSRRRGQERLHRLGAVRPRSVPEQNEGAVEVALEEAQERHHLGRGDVPIGMEPKIHVHVVPRGRHTQRGDDGHLLMSAGAVLEDWRVSSGTPRLADQGSHEHAALIEKCQPHFQARGFFLTPGHVCLVHPWMAGSSRSTARGWGFWALQPRARSRRLR